MDWRRNERLTLASLRSFSRAMQLARAPPLSTPWRRPLPRFPPEYDHQPIEFPSPTRVPPLPYDVLVLVVDAIGTSHWPWPDLVEWSLVSKTFHAGASVHLYGTLYLRLGEDDLERESLAPWLARTAGGGAFENFNNPPCLYQITRIRVPFRPA